MLYGQKTCQDLQRLTAQGTAARPLNDVMATAEE
jgi:hypothetical protein